MHIEDHARDRPYAPAVIMDNGRTLSFAQLDRASIALANYFHSQGLQEGDTVCVILENCPDYFIAAWAALRKGLYLTPINWHLRADEVRHIVDDSASRLLVTSAMHRQLANAACSGTACAQRIVVDECQEWQAVGDALQNTAPVFPAFTQSEGQVMFYSSGTTGKPKGIKRPIGGRDFGTPSPIDGFIRQSYDITQDTIYLSPAPAYHAAPLNWVLAILRFGGSIIMMSRFDPERAIDLIARHRVTHAQFVPTMFVRMLKLPDAMRATADVSSLKVAVHAAAPCPPQVKHDMLDWWGPVIHEYYGGSEGNGVTAINPEEWLQRPGSVGRAVLGELHICDDDDNEMSPGETGTVYFSGMPDFSYHNDPEKTRRAYNKHGWSTLGDVGHVDADGYLFLTDRKAFMIISGGVNIYPQEVENLLIGHPAVMDVAVIGLPHTEFGEEVVAVVQPAEKGQTSAQLAQEIIDYCRDNLATFKCPRRVLFDDDLPRMPNGKLLKRLIKTRAQERAPA